MRKRKKVVYIDSLKRPITPETTVIVFDLHNVVLKKQLRKIVFASLKLMSQGTWRYTLNPGLWYQVYRLKAHSDVAEDIFQKLVVRYPGLAPFRKDFIQLTNYQKLVNKMMDLIAFLKGKGYRLYILSNIGKETFEDLSNKYPELVAYFDGVFTATAENDYKHKPHAIFYEQFKEYLNEQQDGDKQILFIDDLKRNIVAAARSDIAGIQFKSSRMLKKVFEKIGIM